MANKKQITFQNHWLNMQHSIEENLTYSHQRQQAAAVSGKKTPPPQNAWLYYGDSSERVMQIRALTVNNEHLLDSLKALRGMGLASFRSYRLVARFQALKQTLAQRSSPALQAEYAQLSEQVMPTLARINQRMAARQLLIAGAERALVPPVAEDAMDVALRAVDKRRR